MTGCAFGSVTHADTLGMISQHAVLLSIEVMSAVVTNVGMHAEELYVLSQYTHCCHGLDCRTLIMANAIACVCLCR